MKIILLLTSFFSLLGFAQTVTPARLIPRADSNLFYAVDHKTLILHLPDGKLNYYPQLLKTQGQVLRKIPLKEIADFGLKKGDTFQVVDFSSGERSDFTLSEEVYIWLQKDDFYEPNSQKEDNNFYRSFRLVLSNDPSEVKKLTARETQGADSVTGVAYRGRGVKLLSDKMSNPLFLEVDGKDALTEALAPHYKAMKSELTVDATLVLTKSKRATVGAEDFVLIQGSYEKPNGEKYTASDLLLKKDQATYYSLKENFLNGDYSIFNGEFQIGKIIEGPESVLLRAGDGMHDCHRLILIYKDKLEEVKLACDSGGC